MKRGRPKKRKFKHGDLVKIIDSKYANVQVGDEGRIHMELIEGGYGVELHSPWYDATQKRQTSTRVMFFENGELEELKNVKSCSN